MERLQEVNAAIGTKMLDEYIPGWKSGAVPFRGPRYSYTPKLKEEFHFEDWVQVNVSDTSLKLEHMEHSIEITIDHYLPASEHEKRVRYSVFMDGTWVASFHCDVNRQEILKTAANDQYIVDYKAEKAAAVAYKRYLKYYEKDTPDFTCLVHKLFDKRLDLNKIKESHYNGAWCYEVERDSSCIYASITIRREDSQKVAVLDMEDIRRKYLRDVDIIDINKKLSPAVESWDVIGKFPFEDIRETIQHKFGDTIGEFNDIFLDNTSRLRIEHGDKFTSIVSNNIVGVETLFEKLVLEKDGADWIIDICADGRYARFILCDDNTLQSTFTRFPYRKFTELLGLLEQAHSSARKAILNMHFIREHITDAISTKMTHGLGYENKYCEYINTIRDSENPGNCYAYVDYKNVYRVRDENEPMELTIMMRFPERTDEDIRGLYTTADVIAHVNALRASWLSK